MYIQNFFKIILLIISSLSFTACNYNRQYNNSAPNTDDAENLTVGQVQRKVRVGMTTSEVAEVLGSPNIVSTDEQRREVWIYDKVATNVTYSRASSSSGAFLILFNASNNRNKSESSSSQRTLTVIIKFDNNSKVRDFAYHTSKF